MPLRETPAATGGCAVLSNEYRMTAPRRLLAVISRRSRREAVSHELAGVLHYSGQTLRVEVIAFHWPEVKTLPECRGA